MKKRELKLTFVLFEASKHGEDRIVISDEDLPEFPEELKEFMQEEEEDGERIKMIRVNEVCKEEKEIGIGEFDNIKNYYFEPDDMEEVLGESELIKRFKELKGKGKLVFVVPFVEYSTCDTCYI